MGLTENFVMLSKVIFVSGTSFSGSTMLDMILANDPAGFSCGQVYNMFYPTKRHQVNPPCDCGATDCSVWSTAYAAGSRNLYRTISTMFPDARFVVDSSKAPCWVARQDRIARAQGLEVKHVLTWKSPEGLAKSFAKRGRSARFVSTYLDYHRSYVSLIPDWIGVQHESLIDEPGILGRLCEQIGIPMLDGKQRFWEKQHHTLFGNNSAKVSLFTQDHPRFDAIRKMRVRIDGEHSAPVAEHRSIYHGQASAAQLENLGDAVCRDLEKVAAGLRARSLGQAASVSGETVTAELPHTSRLASFVQCAANSAYRQLAKLRYRQHFE
jgi:hypothetical protein